MKNYRNNDSGMRKVEHKTSKHENSKKKNKIGYKEERATEEEYQASFVQKSYPRESTCYLCGKPGHISPDFPKLVSTPKDEWTFQTETKHLCSESPGG